MSGDASEAGLTVLKETLDGERSGEPLPPASSELSIQLAAVATEMGMTPDRLQALLQEVWDDVRDDPDLVRALAKSKLEGRGRYRGYVPATWTDVLECPHCGPVWIWPPAGQLGEPVIGCPWCHVRHRQGAVPAAAKVTGENSACWL
ncbi:hypothetical protein [Thiohalorhabdus sp.]|uniref:hypothetical protein n=1 Tax=Thiohalorhabdus sp. TaxID=3094134 RepID=UPI002FC396A4